MIKDKIYNILFVCIENSCRSQMAEAFARMYGNGRVRAWSAGSRPSGVVNQRAVSVMLEKGYDLGTHTSKQLDDLPKDQFDVVVTMGCGDACPFVRTDRREDWEIPDPRDMPMYAFRQIRDIIEMKVRHLISEI